VKRRGKEMREWLSGGERSGARASAGALDQTVESTLSARSPSSLSLSAYHSSSRYRAVMPPTTRPVLGTSRQRRRSSTVEEREGERRA
jgi:hypothetical protein